MKTKYKQIALTIVLGFASVVTSKAILGETPEECAVRYGAPTKTLENETVYKNGDFEYKITFYKGKADRIIVKKPIPNDFKTNPISDQEIQGILLANSKGATWKEITTEKKNEKKWETENKRLTAGYTIGNGFYPLIISTAEGLERYIQKLINGS